MMSYSLYIYYNWRQSVWKLTRLFVLTILWGRGGGGFVVDVVVVVFLFYKYVDNLNSKLVSIFIGEH